MRAAGRGTLGVRNIASHLIVAKNAVLMHADMSEEPKYLAVAFAIIIPIGQPLALTGGFSHGR